MIKNDYAWQYKKYFADTRFEKVENQAHLAKNGLKQMRKLVAPWCSRREIVILLFYL